MKRIKRLIFIICALLLLVPVAVAISDTVSFKNTEYGITDENLPESFSGFKIAMVSDLHNAQFGKNNSKLIYALKESQPDIIVITGDLVDSSHTNVSVAVNFAENAVKIAPTYYVSGNHEAWLPSEVYQSLKDELTDKGVKVLENESADLERNGDFITLIGADDPDFFEKAGEYAFTSTVADLAEKSEHYTILLSHRPEYFDCYCENGINLVLSGHTHAGQIRIPFIGALLAPGQGLFPEYDKGLFRKSNTSMIVSAGLGNSVIPFRLFNKSELVIITLSAP